MDKFKAPTPKELARNYYYQVKLPTYIEYFKMLWVMVKCSDRRGKN